MSLADALEKLQIPDRPSWLDWLGKHQNHIRFFGPILLLFFALIASSVSITTMSYAWEIDGKEELRTWNMYGDYIHVTYEGIEHDENESGTFTNEYNRGHGDGLDFGGLDDDRVYNTADLAAEQSSRIGLILLLSLLLVGLAIDRSTSGPLSSRFFLASEVVSGITALLIIVNAVMLVTNHVDWGNASPEALGYPGIDGALYGSPASEPYNGGEETIAWAPGLGMWFEIALIFSSILLLMMHIGQALRKDWWGELTDQIGDRFSNLLRYLPSALLIGSVLALGLALALPWAQVTQTYGVEVGENTEDHSVEWSASLWGSTLYNSSMFDSPDSIEVTKEDGSVSASHLGEAVSDGRLQLILATLMVFTPWVIMVLPSGLRERLGPSRVWLSAPLLLGGWVLLTAASKVSGGIATSVNLDLLAMLPNDTWSIIWSNDYGTGGRGHLIGAVINSDAEWIGRATYLDWAPGAGLISAIAAGMFATTAGLLNLTGLHESNANSESQSILSQFPAIVHGTIPGDGFFGEHERGHTMLAMGVAALMFVLTITAGGTLAGLLVSGGDVGPPVLNTYDVHIDDTNAEEFMDGDLMDGESHVFVLNIPATQIQNVTFIHFQTGCSDNTGGFGDSNPIGEDTDSIRIEIDVPEEIGDDIIIDDELCEDNWSFDYDEGDGSSKQRIVRVQARTAADAGAMFTNDTMMLEWTFTVTAIPRGSFVGTGINEDESLYAAIYAYWLGSESIVTEVQEEDE